MDQEEVKRSQRIVHDLSKRLDDLLSRSSHVCDLFTPEGALYRARLRDHAGRLTAADPVRHGAAAAEAFWRKGVYETLSAARGLKQGGQWTPMERAYVVGHVLNGVGHYEHFLWYLLHDFGWSKKVLEKLGPVRLDVISAEEDFGNCKATQAKSRSLGYDSDTQCNWLRETLHKCLMHMGDLYRYLSEFQPEKATIALRYYQQAIQVDGSPGLPYNQMATLAGGEKLGLTPALFYLKSMAMEKPFEGGEPNLRRLLEKNAREFSRISRRGQDASAANATSLPILTSRQETERCVVYLLQMVNVFLYGDLTGSQLSRFCQQALQCVQHCLYLPTEDSAALLPSDVAVKIVLVLLLVMERVKQEAKLSMLRAYLLALFSHFITKFLGDVHVGLYGPESLVELFNEEAGGETEETKDETSEKVAEIEKEKEPADQERSFRKKKKVSKLDKLKRRRRKGARGSLTDEDESSDGSEFEGSYDEGSSNSCSSSQSSNEGDSDSDTETSSDDDDLYANGILHSDSEDDDYDSEDGDGEDDVVVESSRDILSTLNLVKLVGGHSLNGAIRVCGLWLRNSPEVVAEASDPTSSGVLWSRLAKLFTLLSVTNPVYETHDDVDNAFEEEFAAKDSESLFPEDCLMAGLRFKKSVPQKHRGVKWRGIAGGQNQDEVLVQGIRRLLSLYELRDWLCASPDTKLVCEGDEKKVAIGEKKPAKAEEDSRLQKNGLLLARSGENEEAEEEDEKKRVMRSMAHLWLKQEVHELECGGGESGRRSGGGRRGETSAAAAAGGTLRGFAHYSPYIAVDHLALSRHLGLVKEVVASRKFAVIVPVAVIHALDEMKKGDAGARNAIRWLEKQFQDGNRWLRPQRKTESKPLDMITYPKKRERAAWQYFKILECCNHFAKVREDDGSTAGKLQVSLLTADTPKKGVVGDDPSESGSKEKDEGTDGDFSPKGLASAIGVKAENIDDFIQHSRVGGGRRQQQGRHGGGGGRKNNGRGGEQREKSAPAAKEQVQDGKG